MSVNAALALKNYLALIHKLIYQPLIYKGVLTRL